jgi:DNA-binding CsgD family transcriptional regulator
MNAMTADPGTEREPADPPDPGHREGAGPAPQLASAMSLGLESAETEAGVIRVYLAVVQHPEPTRSLLVAQGIAAAVIDRSLALLQDRGLLRVHAGGQVEVLPPDISLPALALDYERRARDTRSAAHELAQVFFHARAEVGTRDTGRVRILNSLDEVAAATAEAVATGTQRIRTFRTLSPRTRQVFDSPAHAHEEPSRGVGGKQLAYTSTYDSAILQIDNILDILESRERGGERFRFSSAVPFSAVIVDETVAIVDLSDFDPSGYGSVLIRSRPLVLALGSLADQLWDLASPLTRSSPSAERRDRTILALLAAGAPDATIARQTGVSQRTVERRVRALMDQLGAGTRFQAGVQAARRGLV